MFEKAKTSELKREIPITIIIGIESDESTVFDLDFLSVAVGVAFSFCKSHSINEKKIDTATEQKTELIKFSLNTSLEPNGSFVNKYPMMVNSGYPVGCAMPKVVATAESSPLSMNVTVGAKVIRYTIKLINNDRTA